MQPRRAYAPVTAEERATLRRLYLAAPRGVWSAPGEQATRGGIFSTDAEGGRTLVGGFFYGEAPAQLVAMSHELLPRLFAELDDLRTQHRGVPILGIVR